MRIDLQIDCAQLVLRLQNGQGSVKYCVQIGVRVLPPTGR